MDTPETVTGPINIGNPDEFSMLQLASLVIEMTGSRSRIVHRPKPEDDPRQRRPDISQARTVLNWQPKTPLKEGSSAPSTISTSCSAIRACALSLRIEIVGVPAIWWAGLFSRSQKPA